MKKYKCIKDFYIKGITFAFEGDEVNLLDDDTVLNCRSGRKEALMQNILDDKRYFMKIGTSAEDNVNHPSHYTDGENGIECIDAMIAAYGKEAVANFCKCNVFKYTFRSGKKQPVLSIEKAEWYLKKYMELAPEFNEEWRLHSNGLYEVSSLGNIRRVDADKNRKKITLKNGYDTVMFSVDGKVTCQYVHRLVAETFIPNPLGLPQINHINHIRTDNRVENLEWCDNKYNVQDAKSMKLYVYNTDGDFIGEFSSIRECEQFFSFSHNSIDAYIDSEKLRGNLIFFTKKPSDEDLKKSQWYQNKYMELKNGTNRTRT